MSTSIRSERLQDCVAGAIFTSFGVLITYLSFGYRGASGVYPGALGVVLACLGLGVAIRGWRTTPSRDGRPLTTDPARIFTTIAISAFYLWLVPVVGFYTASTVVVFALPVALGFRGPILLPIAAVLFMVLVYVTFSIVFERPLPREIFWN